MAPFGRNRLFEFVHREIRLVLCFCILSVLSANQMGQKNRLPPAPVRSVTLAKKIAALGTRLNTSVSASRYAQAQ